MGSVTRLHWRLEEWVRSRRGTKARPRCRRWTPRDYPSSGSEESAWAPADPPAPFSTKTFPLSVHQAHSAKSNPKTKEMRKQTATRARSKRATFGMGLRVYQRPKRELGMGEAVRSRGEWRLESGGREP